MEFRARGNAIDLIRQVRPPDGARPERVLVARVPQDLETLPAEIARRLTETELAEFRDFVSARSRTADLRRRLAAYEIDSLAVMVADELANTEDERELALLIARVESAIVSLRGALARQRAARPAKASASPDLACEPSERG